MKGSFSEESLAQFAELAAQALPADFAEGDTYDFTTCIRPDGSAYGTGGKCRKGTEGQAKEKAGAATGVPVLTKGDMKKMSEQELRDVKKKMNEQAFGKDSGPVSNTKLQMLSDQNKAINEELKSRGAATKSQVDLVTPRKQGQADVDRLKKYGAEEKQKLQNLEDAIKKNPSLANDAATQARKKVLERNVAAADSQMKAAGGRGKD
jgi:hypothetical protein